MPFNVEQAQDVNVVLDALYGPGADGERLHAACKRLAGHAYKRLSAGWSPDKLDDNA